MIEAAPSRPWRDWRTWLSLAARLYLGGMLLVAGAIKLGNLPKFALDIRAYHLVPYEWTKILGYSIPPLEVLVGLLLVAGAFVRVSAAVGALLMAVFTFSIAWVWAKGYSIDCGCFGTGGQVDPSQTHYLRDIIRDSAALVGGLWLIVAPLSRPSVDQWLAGPAIADADELEPALDPDADPSLRS
ncbi:MAG TPA: MauE/DoxX family redox-associated membrane protein [Propionibacteriaceae bacterium]|nr:MauE/DoxX family redox-associated membrane protein [Propionibacteriaceae bacterium]